MKIIILLSLSIIISGCYNYDDGKLERNEKLETIYLEDGTKCIVYRGIKKGGISCDFGN